MDYKKHYERLIERAKNRTLEGYTERHHIVPKCMGGNDDNSNLVKLTPEEHYVAHQLLCKMYPENYALAKAALMMTVNRTNNKIYGWVRKRHAEAMKESQGGENNSQHGTKWIHNLELKESKKIPKSEIVPEGWKLGRKIIWKNDIKQCNYCGDNFKSSDSIFCSSKCKIYKKSPSKKIIDDNLEKLIKLFENNGSITKTLYSLGLEGRVGNSYLSKILKEKGYTVLKRRNTLL